MQIVKDFRIIIIIIILKITLHKIMLQMPLTDSTKNLRNLEDSLLKEAKNM